MRLHEKPSTNKITNARIKMGAHSFIRGENSWMVVVVMSLRETIRSLRVGEVDGVIESAGGWPVK